MPVAEHRTPPCFQRVISLFSLCYLLLEKSSKSLIPLSDFPFVLNRFPVFLGKSPCFQEKTGPCEEFPDVDRVGKHSVKDHYRRDFDFSPYSSLGSLGVSVAARSALR